MEYTDYYSVIGVPKNADQAAIKAAYRALARKLHPDVNKDPAAGERFKRVNEANAVIGDPEKRAKYDRLGADWEQLEQQQEFTRSRAGAARAGGGAPVHSDFFETFFGDGGLDIDELLRQGGGGRARTFAFRDLGPRRGSDIEETVDITLAEAMAGGRRLLTLGERQVEVSIPAGVAAGSRVRVAGEGRPGLNGGDPGDIYLRIHLLPHPGFGVRGRDLTADLDVRDHQAVLGAEIRVSGPAGPLTVTVPAGTQAGRALRLRGKGIPGLGRAARGDLLLTVRITVPPSPSPEELELYGRLRDLRGGAPAGAEAGTAPS